MHKIRIVVAGCFLLTVATVACASSNSLSTGSFTTDAGHQQGPVSTQSSSSECSDRTNADDECAPPVQPPLQAPLATHLSREERTIYLGFNQTTLSPLMKEKLDSLAALLTSQQNVTGVRIIGYADHMGDPIVNEKLSEQRTEAVQQYLVSKGLTKARVADTRWLGSGLPSTDCSDHLPRAQMIDCLQQDRRVEIEVDYQIRAQASR